MTHRLEVAHQAIIAALLLFVCVLALFALDGEFAGKATSGNTATTAYIVESFPANCSFTVGEGYNIVSMPCLSTATPLANVTGNASVLAIYQYVPGDPDPWRVYNPNLPSYVVSDLQHLTRRAGYIALMNSSADNLIEGLRVGSTSVPLAAGWNLVGYPAFVVRNASDAFAPLGGSLGQAVTYNKSSESFVTYPGGLQYTIPGEGYWINATNGTSWTVIPT